ncbi:MAG TPA: long-chain fatty acid--CoA ligase [Candidatus Aminicenantes bacterium]|nr:long-chain fatty acid--CoA ligase [Candidatus Aminicenantes bacterium]
MMPEIQSQTLNDLLEELAGRYFDRPALGWADKDPITYGEFMDRVGRVAELLRESGIGHGDRVAILGENSPNWGIAYFSTVRVGAVAVPILPDFPESDIRHILMDSESKLLFATSRQLEKIDDLGCCQVQYVITLDDFQTELPNIQVQTFSHTLERALDFIKKFPSTIGLKSRQVSADDLASIIYTSGTSGHSKAVMLTHGNFTANVKSCRGLAPVTHDYIFLSMLPLSHTYEFTVGFLYPFSHGAQIRYLDRPPTPRVLEEICSRLRPHAICSVPLILEKIFKKKVLPLIEQKRLVRAALHVPLVRRKIYRKINDSLMTFFGGRLEVMAVGGAPFNFEAERLFRAIGFPYLVGYGLTETAPLLAGGPMGDDSIQVGSIGKVIPGVQIRIHEPEGDPGIGEICAKGENVMKGYYKNPRQTEEVFDRDGWLHTGDLGYFDRYDNLIITGRCKNMILMSNGENIFPEAIEDVLNSMMLVSEALVLERNGRLEAWIYLDYDLVDSETRGRSEDERAKYIDHALAQIKAEANERLSTYSKLSAIIERKEPFIKTATSKIKRYLYTRDGVV